MPFWYKVICWLRLFLALLLARTLHLGWHFCCFMLPPVLFFAAVFMATALILPGAYPAWFWVATVCTLFMVVDRLKGRAS